MNLVYYLLKSKYSTEIENRDLLRINTNQQNVVLRTLTAVFFIFSRWAQIIYCSNVQ